MLRNGGGAVKEFKGEIPLEIPLLSSFSAPVRVLNKGLRPRTITH